MSPFPGAIILHSNMHVTEKTAVEKSGEILSIKFQKEKKQCNYIQNKQTKNIFKKICASYMLRNQGESLNILQKSADK